MNLPGSPHAHAKPKINPCPERRTAVNAGFTPFGCAGCKPALDSAAARLASIIDKYLTDPVGRLVCRQLLHARSPNWSTLLLFTIEGLTTPNFDLGIGACEASF